MTHASKVPASQPQMSSANSATSQKAAAQPSNVSEVQSSRPDTSGSLFSMRAFNAEVDLPIVYSPIYDMYLIGVEMLHRSDTKKYSKMASYLNDLFLDTPFARENLPDEPQPLEDGPEGPVKALRFLAPNRPVSKEELMLHHTQSYVERIHDEKSLIARITETWALNLVPMSVLETRVLTPLKLQVAGTIFATHLAMQHGWAINLGGGFHQASSNDGNTFCILSDVALAMKYAWRKHPLQRYMVIDLDAHPGTGLERDFLELEAKRRKMVYMLDIFNDTIHPHDALADKGANLKIPLGRFTGDDTFLHHLEASLKEAAPFKPNLIFYLAGQDVLKDDQLGLMNITDQGLMRRDELVFSFATEKLRCPIVMLMSGGYLDRGLNVQMDSIRNLYNKGLIWGGFRSGSRSLSRPRPKVAAAAETSKSTSKNSHSKSKSKPKVPAAAETSRSTGKNSHSKGKSKPPTPESKPKAAHPKHSGGKSSGKKAAKH